MAIKQPITLGKMRLLLRLMGLFQIPLLAFVKPRILVINDEKCVVKIRNRRRVKNHLKSMYFGALCVGADVAGGLPVFFLCETFVCI
jgi:acyl-coenzyme A thioesterase PaaI-like protein